MTTTKGSAPRRGRRRTYANVPLPVPRGGCARRDNNNLSERLTSGFELSGSSWPIQPRRGGRSRSPCPMGKRSDEGAGVLQTLFLGQNLDRYKIARSESNIIYRYFYRASTLSGTVDARDRSDLGCRSTRRTHLAAACIVCCGAARTICGTYARV